jgi:hypothetical protein
MLITVEQLNELMELLQDLDECTQGSSPQVTDGYIRIPDTMWAELMDMYDMLKAEEAVQK